MQTDKDLDGLQCLHDTDDAGNSTQDAQLFATPRHLRSGRFGKYATVTGSRLAEVVDTKLTFVFLSGTTDEKFSESNGGVRQKIPSWHVVRAIYNDVVWVQERHRVGRIYRLVDGFHSNRRVDSRGYRILNEEENEPVVTHFLIAAAAESTLDMPIVSSLWSTCLCMFESSTVS